MKYGSIPMFGSRRSGGELIAETGQLYYPNRMGRIVMLAMEQIVGPHGVSAILNLAGMQDRVGNYPPNNMQLGFTFQELSAIQETLEVMFGVRGGRALAWRSGRETFRFALTDFMPVMGIADLVFRPIHLGIKLKVGLEVFAETFNKFTDQIVRLSEDREHHHWIIERCPVCWGRATDSPCCHLAVGLLTESLKWVSNGKRFQVTEVECVAAGGDRCLITIAKKPLA